MSEKDVRRYVRKEFQKEYQNNFSEDMLEKDIRKYLRKGWQEIFRQKWYKEDFYWTVSIELQAPRRLKIDVATTILT